MAEEPIYIIKADPASMYLLSEHPSAPTCYPVSYPQLSSPGLPFPQRPFLNNQDLLFTHHFFVSLALVYHATCLPAFPFSFSLPIPSPHMAQFSLVMSNLNPHRYLTILSHICNKHSLPPYLGAVLSFFLHSPPTPAHATHKLSLLIKCCLMMRPTA